MGSRSRTFEGGSLRLYRESLAGVHALDRDVERGVACDVAMTAAGYRDQEAAIQAGHDGDCLPASRRRKAWPPILDDERRSTKRRSPSDVASIQPSRIDTTLDGRNRGA